MFTAKETGITGINLISLFFPICFHSDGDEDEMASPLPTFTQPTPATPSTSRKRSATSGKKKVKTAVYCRKCEVPLCFTSKKNCYEEWHA